MRVSSRFVIDVSCTPEHSPARSASQKTQRISISSITQTAARLEVIKILAALSDRAGKPNSESSGLTADQSSDPAIADLLYASCVLKRSRAGAIAHNPSYVG